MMKKHNRISGSLFRFLLALLVVFVCVPEETLAAGLSGHEIMMKVYERPEGNDQSSDLTMELINFRGSRRVRMIRQKTKDYGSVEKKVMTFQAPADVRGTSFMNWSYSASNRNDDQWIYLPALRRVTRISSESTSDYFMGSDFTYDDLGDRHPSKDRHTIVKTETYRGERCIVIDSTSIKPGYMYSRTRTWVIEGKWIGLKREFFDRRGKLLKILSVEDYRKISGFWIIVKSQMQNIQRNHKTVMSLANVRINQGVQDRFFTTGAMERGL